LDDRAAEIKTMHVLEEMRGRGTGMLLLHHVFAVAKAEGVHQLKLETGSNEGFAASRRLYERAGFEHCAPWGAYTDDPFSYCMARAV
ncbi:MAG: GNAT family N-acetyltransferase, partial [Pseudomonadota bacterium]